MSEKNDFCINKYDNLLKSKLINCLNSHNRDDITKLLISFINNINKYESLRCYKCYSQISLVDFYLINKEVESYEPKNFDCCYSEKCLKIVCKKYNISCNSCGDYSKCNNKRSCNEHINKCDCCGDLNMCVVCTYFNKKDMKKYCKKCFNQSRFCNNCFILLGERDEKCCFLTGKPYCDNCIDLCEYCGDYANNNCVMKCSFCKKFCCNLCYYDNEEGDETTRCCKCNEIKYKNIQN